jgi:hypothetical protein
MPVNSERVSPHRSLIYSQIKYIYSEYPVIVNTFCCTDPFTINGIDCSFESYLRTGLIKHVNYENS